MEFVASRVQRLGGDLRYVAMDEPLGSAVGNALEVREAIETMQSHAVFSPKSSAAARRLAGMQAVEPQLSKDAAGRAAQKRKEMQLTTRRANAAKCAEFSDG